MGTEEHALGSARRVERDRAGSGLSDAQLDEVERRLVARMEALAAQARDLRELRRRLCPPTGGVDAVCRMLDSHIEANRTQFSSAAAALRTIGDEGFGRCADCGSPIGFARLERAPSATRCPPCGTARPSQLRRHPTPSTHEEIS